MDCGLQLELNSSNGLSLCVWAEILFEFETQPSFVLFLFFPPKCSFPLRFSCRWSLSLPPPCCQFFLPMLWMSDLPAVRLRGCPRGGGRFAAASLSASSELTFPTPAVRSWNVYVVNRCLYFWACAKNIMWLFCSLYMSVTFHVPTFPRGQVYIYVFVVHSNTVQQHLAYAEWLQEQLMSCAGLHFEFACLLEHWQLLNFNPFSWATGSSVKYCWICELSVIG